MIVFVVALVALVLVYLRPRVLAQPPAVLARLPMLAPVPPTALTAPAPWRAAAVHPTAPWRAALALGGVEARRLLVSPLFAVAFVLALLNNLPLRESTEFGSFNAYALGGPAALWCGLIMYFAGNLAATRARRDRATELLAPAPLDPRMRVLALTIAALAAGAVFLLLFVAGWVYWWDVREIATARPTVWHLLLTPTQVVGGVVLGVMVATWAPWRGVAPAVFFALVAGHLVMASKGQEAWGAFVEFARWPDQGGGFEPISPAWHLAYMVLLCAMAVVGAMVWLPGRRRGLLALGAALTLGALGAGLAQV